MEYDQEIRQPEIKLTPLHFAMILMTMLATILGVTTYLNYK
ncbi:MAG TPA: hypothetical protein VLA12_22815 [Planctomycetaceae bacterium]|nr:hypothetical protein [Planctomycetaceae bacterium]